MELYIIIIAVIVAVGILISSIMNAKSAKKNINGIIVMALAGVCAVIFMLFGFMFSSFTVYLLFIILVAVLLLMVFLLMQFVRHKREKKARAFANGNTDGNARKLGVRARAVSEDKGASYPDDLLQQYFTENEPREFSGARADEVQSAEVETETMEASAAADADTAGLGGQPAISYDVAGFESERVEVTAGYTEDKIAFAFASDEEQAPVDTFHAELPTDMDAVAGEAQETVEAALATDFASAEAGHPEAERETYEETAAEAPAAGMDIEEPRAEEEAEETQETVEETPAMYFEPAGAGQPVAEREAYEETATEMPATGVDIEEAPQAEEEDEETQETVEETPSMDFAPAGAVQPVAEREAYVETAAEMPAAGFEAEESQAGESVLPEEAAMQVPEEEGIIAPETYPAPGATERERSVLGKADGLKEQGRYLVAYGLFQSALQNAQNLECIKYAELQMLDCLVLAGQTEDASRLMFGILNRKYDLTTQEKLKLKETMTVLHNADRQKTV